MSKRLGIYIHIPFCVSKCSYCDFYSLPGQSRKMPDYQAALLSHISESASNIEPYEVDSVYIGGGTPSCYGAERIVEILDELKRIGNLRLDAEITMEANPDTVRLKDLKLLRREGVNRLSLGVQSANNDILKMIGRRHSFRQAEMAVDAAREAGFDNVSLDLIYGLPSQNKADWALTLQRCIELHPEHISCYGLKLEEGTPMYNSYKGSALIPSDDEQADMYLFAVDTLAHYGLQQYEISNFAVPGYESRHNLKYWQLGDYMGFGPGAHSCVGDLRYSYVRSLNRYIEAVKNDAYIIDEYEPIVPVQRAAEYIMLGLRTTAGICREEYRSIYKSDWTPIEAVLRDFVTHGWARCSEDERWSLTPAGMLVSNTLINAVLEAQTGAKVETNPWMRPMFEAAEKTELPQGDNERFEEFYRKMAGKKD